MPQFKPPANSTIEIARFRWDVGVSTCESLSSRTFTATVSRFDAMLSDIREAPVDKIVCLGDTVQGGPQPTETIARLRQLDCPVVMGNADDWLLKNVDDTVEPVTPEQREVRAWTLSKLSPKDLEFLRNYKPTVEVVLEGSRLLRFHGSPSSYDDILLPDTPKERWDELLGEHSPAIMTGGHTHTQQVRRIREGLFFNPGNIGVAYDYSAGGDNDHTDSWAEYAILSYEENHLGLEFRRADYDPEALIKIIRASGWSHADRMIKGYRTA